MIKLIVAFTLILLVSSPAFCKNSIKTYYRFNSYVNVIKTDSKSIIISNGNYNIQSSKSLYSILKNENKTCGVNASFFKSTGLPLGLYIRNGEILTGSLFNRPVFAIQNGSPVIEHIVTTGTVRIDQVEHELYGFNQPLISTEKASIYTYKYGRYSPTTTTYFYHIQVKDNKVIGISDKSSIIPVGGFVLVINKKFIPKDVNEVSYDMNTSVPNLSQAIAGGPTLIKNNKIQIERKDFKSDILDSRRNRTAVGFTKTGTVLLVTVRGNITIRQLATIMYELGCSEAMNLDGGGSAQMIYRNRSIVRSKRWISTAILTN